MPAAAKKVEPKPEVKRAVILSPGRMQLMEVHHNMWSVHAEAGTVIEDLSDRAFWSAHSEKLKPYDEVRVIPDEGTWLAHCLVIATGKNWADVQILEKHTLGSADMSQISSTHKTMWRGPELKWSVVRQSDGAVIKDKLDTLEQAQAYLRENEKTA